MTLPAPIARGTIAATTSALRDSDRDGTSAGRTASPGFCRHERFPAPADRLHAPPRICRCASQVFAAGKCRCASSDRIRCRAAGSICCRAARRSRCRYQSNARPHRSRTGADSSYRSTSCRPAPPDCRTCERSINNNNNRIACVRVRRV